MLHLLPLSNLIRALIFVISAPLLIAVAAGYIGTENASIFGLAIIRYSYIATLAVVAFVAGLWRWSAHVQALIFPYLGGEWAGEVEFVSSTGRETRPVTLQINHNIAAISLLLKSAESDSRTLSVHAARDRDVQYDRLYYVYRNERREGVLNAGYSYRGTAILGVHGAKPLRLEGNYFTEEARHGLLRLQQVRRHPAWAIWK